MKIFLDVAYNVPKNAEKLEIEGVIGLDTIPVGLDKVVRIEWQQAAFYIQLHQLEIALRALRENKG